MVTGYAAGIYLKQLNFDKKVRRPNETAALEHTRTSPKTSLKLKIDRLQVYIFGSTGIAEEFKLLNIDHTGIGPDPLPHDLGDFTRIELDPAVEAVVLGFDYTISYPKLIRCCSYGKRVRPELFIATNLDETLPTTHSHLCVPGTGAVVSIIR